MKSVKSERLRKLEAELTDLEQWLKLGLVPKKDIEKHKEEIHSLQSRIAEEKERLRCMKDDGDIEEYIAPKRQSAKAGYNDMPTIPDIDMTESGSGLTDTGFDTETYLSEETGYDDGDQENEEGSPRGDSDETQGAEDADDEDESYFSDKNRWRRGGIIDPDADEW